MAAEQMLGIVVEAVVSQAFSLARERISAAWGVEKDLQSLAQTLETIQDMLSDAETKSKNGIRSVETWLRKLEDATTDGYLLLEEYGYYVLRKQIEKPQILKKVRRHFSSSNPIAFRLKMASNIKEIKLQMDGIFKEAERIELVRNAITENSSNIDVRKDRIITGPFVTTSDIVGRKVDAEKIVTELTSFNNQNDDLPVIGIVGMAGQGKTTLAQLVFKNEEVTRSFEKKIWVCVSDDFIVEKILNDMLQSLTGIVSKLTVRQAIVDQLKRELKEKRFLLVLDDVWNEVAQKWSDMMTCLQEISGSKGSKITVTTRNMQVISIMRPSFTHPLGALTEEESWELFEKIAFANGEAATTKDLMDEAKKVVQKCCGLPLAIKALAGLMYSNRNANYWSKIVESNIWNSIDLQRSIMPIVKLSYDDLPSLSLKQCFVYCSIFPKDSIIEKEMLIQQWMAHGLLNPSQGSKLEMEDIGTNYFQILLQRSLFQDVELDEFGNINSCKMHDVVHDFVSQASKDRCLIIEDGMQIQDTKALHWCISDNRSESIDVTIPFRLRTLLLFNPKSFSFGKITEYKYLCVLVLRDWSLVRLPNSVAKMKYLRNLDISRTSIQRLPNSITKLYNLQTLKLYALQEFPRDFGSLVKLRHFHISYVPEVNSFPPEISKMTSLRTLSCFVVSKTCQIKELKSLNNLEGKLEIHGLENVSNREDAMKADLSKKGNILDLELYWGGMPVDDIDHENVLEGLKPHSNLKGLKISGFAGKNLPSWIQFLDNLVRMELSFSCCEQITALGQFPCLKFVKILAMENLKCIGKEFYGVTSSPWKGSFPSLTELHLSSLRSLEEWSDPSSDESNIHHGVVFPVLEILKIIEVPKFNQLPNVLNRRIPFLKKLELIGLDSLEDLSWGSEELSVEELTISRCYKLSTLGTTGERLKSLRRLNIEYCDKLDISQSRIDLCSKLEDLQTTGFLPIQLENLLCPPHLRRLKLASPWDNDGEDFPWPCGENSFAFLENLELDEKNYSKNIKSLPKQILDLPALTYMVVRYFDGIEALPEWLCNIPSLRRLEFFFCEKLAYLPSREALQRLTTACRLTFWGCSLLKERCNEGSGPEWDKIKHLPNILFM